MDTRNGDIYASAAEAKAAGVPEDRLVTGSPEAIADLSKMMRVFTERAMRRRMGKSARQWKKDRKAERRGSRLTQAKAVRRAMIMTNERGRDVAAERLVKRHAGAMVIGR